MYKVEELLKNAKIDELIRKNDEKKSNKCVIALAIIGGIVLVAGIAYAVYRFLAPKFEDDFEDAFEDEFDEDFFDEAAEEVEDVFEE